STPASRPSSSPPTCPPRPRRRSSSSLRRSKRSPRPSPAPKPPRTPSSPPPPRSRSAASATPSPAPPPNPPTPPPPGFPPDPRRLAATVHEQLGTVRLLAIGAALGPSVLLALPTEERVHLPYALLGSVAVLVSAILARRRTEAVGGIATLGGLIGLKAIEWMI